MPLLYFRKKIQIFNVLYMDSLFPEFSDCTAARYQKFVIFLALATCMIFANNHRAVRKTRGRVRAKVQTSPESLLIEKLADGGSA